MENKIYLLDCTLRDGGYVNNWNFGYDAIKNIKEGLELSGVDIIELGFIRKEKYDKNRAVFSCGMDFNNIMATKNKNVIYSAMIEGCDIENLYPVELLAQPSISGLDYIRVCTWKRLMREHFDYCKTIVKAGYQVSLQPTAVEQYSFEEFTERKLQTQVLRVLCSCHG